MADPWHVNWLSEGVRKWNLRRKKVKFHPDLSGVVFFDLLPQDFRDSPKTSRYFERIDLSGSDLTGSDLSGLNFQKAKFSNSDLSGADLSRSNFVGAQFDRANLSGVKFSASLLDDALFENTILERVSFEGASLGGALFIKSVVSDDQLKIAKSRSAQVFESRESYLNSQMPPGGEKSFHTLADKVSASGVETAGKTKKIKYDVYFGTNRVPVFERGALIDFSGDLNKVLSYGDCEVIVPEGHRIGSLGSSIWRRLYNWSDDRLRIQELIHLNDGLFWELLREASERMRTKERPTIFVHGFNTTFQQGVLRAAQIGYDLGLGQGIALFSWPSKGKFWAYSADEAASEASKYHLASFIEQFVQRSAQKSVNIIAHSMGCRVTLGALEVLASGKRGVLRAINQIILAAADVDAAIMPNLGAYAVKYATRTTSYVSDKDTALTISGWLHDFPRVGVMPPTFVLEGMDTILVNDLDLGEFSHGYLGASRTILNDIFSLLKANTPPAERHAIEAVSSGSQTYWKIKN